ASTLARFGTPTDAQAAPAGRPLLRSDGSGKSIARWLGAARSAPIELDQSVCNGCFTTTVADPSSLCVRVTSYPLFRPGTRSDLPAVAVRALGSKTSAFASSALSSAESGAPSVASCADTGAT